MVNQIERLNARLQRAEDRLLKIPVVQLISLCQFFEVPRRRVLGEAPLLGFAFE